MSSKVAKRDDDIVRVAASIYASHFQPAKCAHLAPREGTLMRGLWNGKKLSLRHQQAWKHFTADLHEAHGKSGPITSGYGESTGGRNPSDLRVPRAFVNHQYRRLEKLFNSMSRQERVLLADLMQNEVRPTNALQLDLIGFHLVGYRNEDQARASGVTAVLCLVERIAEFYQCS